LFMRWASAIVVVDEELIPGIGGIPNKNIVTVYDSPPDYLVKDEVNAPVANPNNVFTLFYAGQLIRDRLLNLDKVIAAIKDIEGVKLVVAGYGDMAREIVRIADSIPEKLKYIGKISYAEVIRYGRAADLFFVLRDPVLPFYRYICGSSMFNAMICGKPILVNLGTSTTLKVTRENCGLTVNSGDVGEIKRAIIKLRDNPSLCHELGTNARRAYELTYGWVIMGQRLVDLYNKLTQEVDRAGKA
jgi:glycosyltransferase involved in cell wall biosynthesis